MSGWLVPTQVLPLAGYAVPVAPDPLPDNLAAALAFAEQAIEARTGLKWGASVTETLTIRQAAATYLLRLPRDVTAVSDVVPAIASNQLWELQRHGLELFDAAYDQLPWQAGTYRLEVERGIVEIPAAINRAGALLAQHYLSLADAERSRYDFVSLGDFSGTERRDAFPVPAAEQLLRPWISNVAVA